MDRPRPENELPLLVLKFSEVLIHASAYPYMDRPRPENEPLLLVLKFFRGYYSCLGLSIYHVKKTELNSRWTVPLQ